MSGEAPSSSTRGPKQITGIVTSAKMQKTRAVQVVRLERHEKYGKFVRRHTTFKVHDEKEVSREGDTVLIVETRPISKTKRWRLIEVIEKSRYGGALAVPGAEDSAVRAAEAAAGAALAAEDAAARAAEAEAASAPSAGEEGVAP
jgi:small subunit ribosomal protein S17